MPEERSSPRSIPTHLYRFRSAENLLARQLSDKEKDAVKKIAKDLLAKLKSQKLVLDWREKMQARADVQRTIRLALRPLPPVYLPELKRMKTNLTYAHVYDSYFGAGNSLYQPQESGRLL